MNKPYFTKYIPVEGEIKPNDLYLASENYPQIILPRSPISKPDEDEGYKDLKKVKLFLCSRDIQYGDKVLNVDTNKEDIVGSMSPFYYDHQPNYVKVIGEVSPNAIWVKERMEFGEDEIVITPMYERYSDPAVFKYNDVMFRCPTCNTLH